jgi:diguanylate cyclase (GGDEF)-like protein
MAKIFLVDDDDMNLSVTALFLRAQGYEVETATSGQRALPLIMSHHPDLIVTDLNMPGMGGIELCRALRSDARTALTPLIFISGASSVADKLACFEAGADDYISKPVDQRELQARIMVQLRKVAERGAVNSLTILPGGRMVESILHLLVQRNEFRFAVLYVDLDSFKAYNDYYGFARGNQVILLLADVLRHALGEESDELSFVGHIGGDDFIVITALGRAAAVCQKIISDFDARIADLYDPLDRERGYIVTPSRQGVEMTFPITSLSIGVITNEQRTLDSVLQIGQLSAEVKHKAKLTSGSSYYFDQGRD